MTEQQQFDTGTGVAVRAQLFSREEALRICNRIEDTMEALLQLIEAESALLRAGKSIAAAALDPRKSDYARAYLQELELLRLIGHELERLAPESVRRLRRQHEEFVAVLQIDMAALATARAAAKPARRTGGPRLAERAATPPQAANLPGRYVPPRLAASGRR